MYGLVPSIGEHVGDERSLAAAVRECPYEAHGSAKGFAEAIGLEVLGPFWI